MDNWCQCQYPVQPPTGTNASKQSSWDMPSVDTTFNSLLAVSQMTIRELGLLLSRHLTVVIAQCSTHHFVWSSHGRRYHSFVVVGLRLGISVRKPHQYI